MTKPILCVDFELLRYVATLARSILGASDRSFLDGGGAVSGEFYSRELSNAEIRTLQLRAFIPWMNR